MDRLGLAVVSALRQADRKRVTALCTEAFEHLQKQRFGQADHDVPEHLAYDTIQVLRTAPARPLAVLRHHIPGLFQWLCRQSQRSPVQSVRIMRMTVPALLECR